MRSATPTPPVYFEQALTQLVWITSLTSIALTFISSYLMLGHLGGNAGQLWWLLAIIVSFGTLAGALIPELVKVFTSTSAKHVREVVKSSREGGPSLNILSGLVAGTSRPTGWAWRSGR